MKKLLAILAALALMAAVLPAAASARCDSSCQQIKKLKSEGKRLRREVKTFKGKAAASQTQVATLSQQVVALNAQVAGLSGEVATLRTPGALPGLIGAVGSTNDFKAYVLDPAATRWRALALGDECAEYSQEGSSWLYQFWSPDLC